MGTSGKKGRKERPKAYYTVSSTTSGKKLSLVEKQKIFSILTKSPKSKQ